MSRYAVATHGRLLLVDEEGNGRELGTGYHYGLSVRRSPDGDVLLALYSGPDVSTREQARLRAFALPTGDLLEDRSLSPWYDAIHQLASDGERTVIVNTARNAVAVLDPDGVELARHHVRGRYRDVHHVNSAVLLEDGLLVMLHNYGRRRSEVVGLRFDGDRLVEQFARQLPDTMCHNVFVDEAGVVYNASPSRSLRRLDLDTGTFRSLVLDRHAKGLAVTGDAFVVGASDFAERASRAVAGGSLEFIDRVTLTHRRSVEVHVDGANPGNINEIRSIDDEHGEHRPGLTLAELERRWPRRAGALSTQPRAVPQLVSRSLNRRRRDLAETRASLNRLRGVHQ